MDQSMADSKGDRIDDVGITATDNMVVRKDDTDADMAGDDSHAPRRSRFATTMILIALALSLFLAALDQTIVLVAVPTISVELQSASGYTWIGGAYLLANAVSGPVWGKLSDIWGRKPILLICTIWFFASSIVCATSSTIRTLIVGRALQGTAGGGLIQLVIITISDLFSMKQRSLLFGMMEVIWAVSGGTGPLIGGAFTEYATWRWIFWLNLPLSGTAAILITFFLNVHNPRTRLRQGLRAIDWIGSLSIIAVTVMILLGLDFGGQTFAWNSSQVICLIVFGIACIGIFLFGERNLAKYPLMPLRLFNSKHNSATLLVTFVHGIVFMGVTYYLPLYTQSTKAASPLQSGVLLLPLVVLEASSGIVAGFLMHRLGCYREIIWTGTVLMTIGAGLLVLLDAASSTAVVVGLQIVFGLGSGLLFQAVLISIQVMVTQDDIATATATLGFTRNIAASLGVVFGGVIFQNGMTKRAASLAMAGVPGYVVDKISGADAAANVDIAATLNDPAMRLEVAQAFAGSLQSLWIFYTCIAAVGVVASIFIKSIVLSTTHVETKTGLQETAARESVELNPVV